MDGRVLACPWLERPELLLSDRGGSFLSDHHRLDLMLAIWDSECVTGARGRPDSLTSAEFLCASEWAW